MNESPHFIGTVDGCEILDLLIDVFFFFMYRLSTIFLVVQDFFHPQYP